MLRAADRIVEQDDDALAISSSAFFPVPAPAQSRGVAPGPRYGAARSPNWLAIGIILVIHALLIAAILHVRHEAHHRAQAPLTVVNLMPPAAPPPAAETPPPPNPAKPAIVTPAPVVQVPSPAQPQVASIPVAQPAAPRPAAAAPTPAVAVAPPAPPSLIQGGDLSAEMIFGKPPRYPIESRRKHEQGTVVLSLTLGLDGAVESLTIARSSGSSRLDDAARDAVRKWRWRPMMQQGQPVKVKGIVEIPFVLQVGTT